MVTNRAVNVVFRRPVSCFMPKIHQTRFHVDGQVQVANLYTDLLATRQTILTCEDVANKSATSLFCRCDGIWEMTRHNRLLPAVVLLRICYGETGVMDFGKTCYGDVAYRLATDPTVRETGVMHFGL